MKIIHTTLMLFTLVMLFFIDGEARKHATMSKTHELQLSHQIELLQTDVSDLKQSVDALGVACMARR